jgi:hypothetical protein
MKTVSLMVLGTFLIVLGSGRTEAAGQNARRDAGRVCFYKDANYAGWEQCYNVGDEVTSMGGRNSQASSIRIYGRVRVAVWSDTAFRGWTTEFDSDVANLQLRAAPEGHTWNDRISSLRVMPEVERVAAPPVVVPAPVVVSPRANLRDGICVYERPNFEGREQCWRLGEEIIDVTERNGFGLRIGSIRVLGDARVTVYERARFRGENLVVERDILDLGRVRGRSWNDRIVSLRVENIRERGRGRGREDREDRFR